MKTKLDGRIRRKLRIRKKIFGTPERPRLTVFRSLKHIYAQIIDDSQGKTLVAASTLEEDGAGNKSNIPHAQRLGQRIAEKAKGVDISQVVFDRNGYIFHGCVKSIADAVREAGLKL